MSELLVDLSGGVLKLTLNRPDRLNSLNAALREQLLGALIRADTDPDVRAVLLTGAGRGFCAGQDLGERDFRGEESAPDLGASLEGFYSPFVKSIAALPKPVLCAVNGVAAGAGANIALACDLVIATRSARFIQSFAPIGLMPDAGGTWFLPRLVGHSRAMGLAFLGEPLSAEDAERWGLIWRVYDDEAFAEAADVLATKLARSATGALGVAKAALRLSSTQTLGEQLNIERDGQRQLGRTADYAEGVRAFHEKRLAEFTGR